MHLANPRDLLCPSRLLEKWGKTDEFRALHDHSVAVMPHAHGKDTIGSEDGWRRVTGRAGRRAMMGEAEGKAEGGSSATIVPLDFLACSACTEKSPKQ